MPDEASPLKVVVDSKNSTMNRSHKKFHEIKDAERHLNLKKAIIDRLTKQKVLRNSSNIIERSLGGSSSQEVPPGERRNSQGVYENHKLVDSRLQSRTAEPL